MTENTTIWETVLRSKPGGPAPEHHHAVASLRPLAPIVKSRWNRELPAFETQKGYFVESSAAESRLREIAIDLLVDPVVESCGISRVHDGQFPKTTVTVLRKPGVMDPVAQSVEQALAELGCPGSTVKTFQRFVFSADTPADLTEFLAKKALSNDAVDQVVFGPLAAEHFATGSDYSLVKITVPLRGVDDAGLEKLSKEGSLALTIEEMRTVQDHFERQGRNPTDIELETIAQTWSEHCSHKTLRGPYEFNGERGNAGLLKATIMHVTRTLNRDWCVSVFDDNAGIIKFDDEWNLCFKVETHNHPSAIEPYGGANTGIGGVIRDPLGTGMGSKPICNTDVFCFAPPTTPYDSLPDGVLHPERVMRGVVSGVRDYGNRMGIPTVNGAVCFDPRYLGNPLVFCGTVGLLPADKSFKKPMPGDLIVALGGRTGRDGIHGATFSSIELTHESESISGGSVQIGNAFTEKKVLDVVLQARDRNLYHAITDCGAGGFSSAVGEMGADIGARVFLDRAPLKYRGLSYTEIWISESQERMILAVPAENWDALHQLAQSEDVEAVVLGQFEPSGKLTLVFKDEQVGEIDMHFLHEGRPAILRKAEHTAIKQGAVSVPKTATADAGKILRDILSSYNVCSKEWVIRQYDHEVQGAAVIRPLVGIRNDGPSDASVLTPILGSTKGIAIGCGINPRFGDIDPYRMAASAIDEALRNVVCVGGDPDLTAILDNFCWGNTARPEVFGSLCLAAFACRDIAIGYGTPFISGKDSLNNEYTDGGKRIVIPPTLLISAISLVPDVRNCVTMDLKEPGNKLVLVGTTYEELGGSHYALVTGATGGTAPNVDTEYGIKVFRAMHKASSMGLLRACHDLSEGGLAVSAAEMAIAGGLGAHLFLAQMPLDVPLNAHQALFSESNTRFLVEVAPENASELFKVLRDVPHAVIGHVTDKQELVVLDAAGHTVVREFVETLRQSWQSPLNWD